MVARVKMLPLPRRPALGRATIAVLVAVLLAGCGSNLRASRSTAGMATIDPTSTRTGSGCAATVLRTLGAVLTRVYREGVFSERTASAQYLITHSSALRSAVETGNRATVRTAAAALLATGHMTNLRVTRGTQTLTDVGGPALAPLRGTLKGAGGAPIAEYVTSVWADTGFLAEASGITQGLVTLQANGHSVSGAPALSSAALGREGTLVRGHVPYQYISLAGEAYPAGAVRIYLLMTLSSTTGLCGVTDEDTTVNTLTRVAQRIYTGESGASAHRQILRVQRDRALLEAVAHRDPLATELAIKGLLNHHIVRLRVSAGGRLLSDVGGPFVLAPVTATLTRGAHAIGSFVLSVQDDEGYLRLARRLAGLDVLMYMGAAKQLVKNSLGPQPGYVPASGSYRYRGRPFRVFTVNAEAFPSGPLTIRVLAPIPYR